MGGGIKNRIFAAAGLAFLYGFVFASISVAKTVDFNKILEPFGAEFDHSDMFSVSVPGVRIFNNLALKKESAVEDDIIRERYYQIKKNSVVKPRDDFDISKIHSLFHLTYTNKVADLKHVKKYDPSGALGFCFGRSMAAHLIALKMGLAEKNIKKLFVIGDLRSGIDPEWRFHVTTIVRGAEGIWYAIDPVVFRAMKMSDWIGRVQRIWDKEKKAVFYITHADAILPDVSVVPAIEEEKGENIIEISFNPLNRPGFDKKNIQGDITPIFELGKEMTYKYFSDAGEKKNGFDFTYVNANGKKLGYHNYFADLTADILSGPIEIPEIEDYYIADSQQAESEMVNLGSMKLHLFK